MGKSASYYMVVVPIDDESHAVFSGSAREIADKYNVKCHHIYYCRDYNRLLFNKYKIIDEKEYDGIVENSQLFIEENGRYYYITNYGNAFYTHKIMGERIVIKREYKKGSDVPFVKMGAKYYAIKYLIAKEFMRREYRPGDKVICIDGNEDNCYIGNLEVVKDE